MNEPEPGHERALFPNLPSAEDLATQLNNARKFGLLLGALEGLKWSVDEPTRAKIDAILKEVNSP